MSGTQAAHLVVHGRVQGVFFRAGTQKQAEQLGLAGWVQNCPDGSVEIHAEGDPQKLEELITWCRKGPPMASVSELEVNRVEAGGFRSFEIR